MAEGVDMELAYLTEHCGEEEVQVRAADPAVLVATGFKIGWNRINRLISTRIMICNPGTPTRE